MNGKLVLYKWNSYPSDKLEKIIAFPVHILMILAIIYAIYVILIDNLPNGFTWNLEDWIVLLDNIWHQLKNPRNLIYTIIFTLIGIRFGIYMLFSNLRERVILTETGIYYKSPWPSLIQWIKPDWSIQWSQIKTAYFQQAKLVHNPFTTMLVIETESFSKKIIPIIWFDYNASQHPSPEWHDFNLSQYYEQIIPHCPIIKYINKMGIEVGHVKATQKTLFTNENSLLAVVLFFLFVVYAIKDSLIINEIYAQTPPYGIYICGGIIVAFLVNIWLIIGKVPKPERTFISIIVGVGFSYALHYGLLRINQFNYTVGLQTYEYVLQENDSFIQFNPLKNKELPILSFSGDLEEEYWSSFEVGTIHKFELRKGNLNFYQVNMEPINTKMYEYYSDKNKISDSGYN